jgi:hypothetical protein
VPIYTDDEDLNRAQDEIEAGIAQRAERRAKAARSATTAAPTNYDRLPLGAHWRAVAQRLRDLPGKIGRHLAGEGASEEDAAAAVSSVESPDYLAALAEEVDPGIGDACNGVAARGRRQDADVKLRIGAELGDVLARVPSMSAFDEDESGRGFFDRVLMESRFDDDPTASAVTRTARGLVEEGSKEMAVRGERMVNPYAAALIEGVGIDRAVEMVASELPDDRKRWVDPRESGPSIDELQKQLDAEVDAVELAKPKTVAQPEDAEAKRLIAEIEADIKRLP